MPWRLRVVILLIALVTLLGVATPPVFEDHAEAGFCSADCPVQHDGRAIERLRYFDFIAKLVGRVGFRHRAARGALGRAA